MIKWAFLIPLFPLLGAISAAIGGRRLRTTAHWPVVLGIAASFIVSCTLLPTLGPAVMGESHPAEESAGREPTVLVYHWIQAGAQHKDTTLDGRTVVRYDLDIPIELRVDGLSVMMLCMVTFVATFVAIFAAGYMSGDPGYPRFFAEVGLFVFCMTGLVLSNNYVLTYAFWEGVGVCSYLLVGFWYAKPSAAAAAKKAFLVNRVGDVGFAIALFLLWASVPYHDLSYTNVLSEGTLGAMFGDARMWIALLLLWAATAKSAQIPLYVWLPDAMEGPTPVSALIHAATMVTAGVYLLARSAPLVFSVPMVPPIICMVGGATALLAALIALTQTDLKRVLAYSTISQLGYMFMALGAGVGDVMSVAVVAAMFHLFTHAFFKALLFLGSGSVMHAMGHVIDMRRFSGLRHRMPITCGTFAIGGLALAGLFPFAGFWSKDEILLALGRARHAAGSDWAGIVYGSVYWLAVVTAGLTAFYTGRAFFKTFYGPEKLPSPDDPDADPDDHGHDHGHDPHFGHESPPVMTVPLVVLAACTIVVGFAFGPSGIFENLLARTPTWAALHAPEHAHGPDWASIGLGTLAAVIGLCLSGWMYALPNRAPSLLASRLSGLYRASRGKFFVDELYTRVVVIPVRGLAAVCRFLDVYVVDNLVRLVAWIPRLIGRDMLAPLQNGLVQFYAAATGVGVALLLLYLLLK